MTTQETENDADFAHLKDAVRKAGVLAMGYFGNSQNDVWRKKDGTSVSDADIAVDNFLREALLEGRADYGWLSEETVDDLARLKRRKVWIVDPIDGTRAFLKDKPHWVVSAALVVDGDVVCGCIFNPARDEFFEAVKGAGAFLNGKKIAVGQCSELEGCTIIAAPGMFKSKKWPQKWPRLESFIVNSIAYRMVLVAAGRADGVLTLRGKNDWDLAAACLIVSEAGGLVSDHNGKSFAFNKKQTRHTSVLAANPTLYAKILARTKGVEVFEEKRL